MSWWRGNYPNRVRASRTAGATTWKIVGLAADYDTYGALLAAGDKPFPGDSNDFPTGVPVMLGRTMNSNADGSAAYIKTNTINTPSASDVGDDLISGSGQTLVNEGVSVKTVWVRQTVSGDTFILTGMF